jgi:serine protease Do
MQQRLAQLEQPWGEERGIETHPPRGAEPAGWMGITHSGPMMVSAKNGALLLTHHGYPRVETVEPGSPAEMAGIEAGDTIVAYDGRDVRTATVSLTTLLTPGRRVVVQVRRDGRTKAIPVVIARRPQREVGTWTPMEPLPPMAPVPPTPPAPDRAPRPPLPPRPAISGMAPARGVAPPAPATPAVPATYVFRWETNAVAGAEVVAMNDDLREAFGGRRGVLVLGVAEGSPAHESGLRGGDVIVRAGRDSVATPAALQRALRAVKKGRSLQLDVVRKGKARTVELEW